MSTARIPDGTPRARRKTLTFYKEVEVEVKVDEDDLEDAGYHREEDCPAKQATIPLPGSPDLADALASLHRQAHPSQHPEVFMCREEPCRSLGLAEIGYL